MTWYDNLPAFSFRLYVKTPNHQSDRGDPWKILGNIIKYLYRQEARSRNSFYPTRYLIAALYDSSFTGICQVLRICAVGESLSSWTYWQYMCYVVIVLISYERTNQYKRSWNDFTSSWSVKRTLKQCCWT